MVKVHRFLGNPILAPNKANPWEAEAAFNGCPIGDTEVYHLVYRAMSSGQSVGGKQLELSTIGHAMSFDRMNFINRRQLIVPEQEWEMYGCEDPRITKIGDKFFIFYTALATFPPTPAGITVAVAVTHDLQKIEEKHHVTPFNAKAMALFPDRVNGKLAAVLTAHTDLPPSKICLALFDDEKQIWDRGYWEQWYTKLDHHAIPLLRSGNDHIEVGAPPVKTDYGWILLFCYISNYQSSNKIFGIEAVLLDLNNPLKVLGRTSTPLLSPERDYELHGKVDNVIFPSGALAFNNSLGIYYGAADTTCCLATCSITDLIKDMAPENKVAAFHRERKTARRFANNPIIEPIPEHSWESKFTFNPAAVFERDKVHIVYRAMGSDDTSVLGLATSKDGVHIDDRLVDPIYVPREDFEKKLQKGNSGCEDARITKIGERLYMCYTAFDAVNPPRVALTSISVDDFCNQKWNWEKPILISPPGIDDKDACVFPEMIEGKYIFLHRLQQSIWIDRVNSLTFPKDTWLAGQVLLSTREDKWDSLKIGIGPPPIRTAEGWILIYHGLSKYDNKYRLGVVLLDLANPSVITSRLDYPILEPESPYQHKGFRPGTVFACGAIVKNNEIFMYYGGADQVVSVASMNLADLLNELKLSQG